MSELGTPGPTAGVAHAAALLTARDSVGTFAVIRRWRADSVAWLLRLWRQRGMVAAGAGGGPGQRGSLAAVTELKINLG
jgi:hypothetical protein